MDPSWRIIGQNVKNGRERRGDLKGEIARQHLQHASISVKLDQALIERTGVAVGIDIEYPSEEVYLADGQVLVVETKNFKEF